MNALVTTTPNHSLQTAEGFSVLGARAMKIPIGGKIRAGIMVLTGAAKQHPRAQSIYDTGVNAGESFDKIKKALIDQCKFDKSPLTPRNVPYFTVRRSDFAMPECADRLMELYGEERAEGFHLYRFPVIFPVDSLAAVMPHGLNAFTANERVYWSEYGPDGTRFCKTHEKVAIDPRSKRAHRTFGGRLAILRPDNGGVCVPDSCPQYQGRKCNLTGSLLFYVPGIPGSAAIELPTTSFYGMQQARQALEMVGFMRGGRFSGTINGKPIFYITKKLTEVSMIDPETGLSKRVNQWLVNLEADIDMTQVLLAADSRPALELDEDPRILEQDDTDGEYEPVNTAALLIEAPADSPELAAVKQLRVQVKDALIALSIETSLFAPYAADKWGANWGTTHDALQKALNELNQAADDLVPYKQKLELFDSEFPF